MDLMQLVHQNQQARIELSALLDSRFEDLVTAGQAAEYSALVERFNAKFDALSQNTDAIAAKFRLEPEGGAMLASLLQRLQRQEEERLKLQLKIQVLRQRSSLSAGGAEDEHAELEAQLSEQRTAMKECTAAIFELVEEMQCEVADM